MAKSAKNLTCPPYKTLAGGYSILFRLSRYRGVSNFDLPAYASLSRVLQPPQEVRQEQIDAIMQTGLWQAGIRIFA